MFVFPFRADRAKRAIWIDEQHVTKCKYRSHRGKIIYKETVALPDPAGMMKARDDSWAVKAPLFQFYYSGWKTHDSSQKLYLRINIYTFI